MRNGIITAIITVTCFTVSAFATIINIPDDYLNIQVGINASTDGDTVLVHPGTYVENINFNGHNIVLGSLFLTTGDESYIGETVIDGDQAGSVVTISGVESGTAIITGFTLQGGDSAVGAGIFCGNSNIIIFQNIIRNNWTRYGGGGIYCTGGISVITNNFIYNNIALSNGGFSGVGGGLFCYESNSFISGNMIQSNASTFGGGILFEDSFGIIGGNVITDNSSIGTGDSGGGIAIARSSPAIMNNIIVENEAFSTGGGIYCIGGNPTIVNTIIRNNAAESNPQIYGSPEVSYSNIQGGWEGQGNIDSDPLFRDPENGDFHLMSVECGDPFDSPCIDTGSPALLDSLVNCDWGLGTILSDMGAYGGGDSVRVGIDDFIVDLPDRFAILQNYPNPFNPSTTIRYSLPEQTDVRIEIYNILGQCVATVFNGNKQAGYHTITWQADDYPSGVYFARLDTDDRSESIKMVLLK